MFTLLKTQYVDERIDTYRSILFNRALKAFYMVFHRYFHRKTTQCNENMYSNMMRIFTSYVRRKKSIELAVPLSLLNELEVTLPSFCS
jgi:hypothetical protein